MKELKIRRAVGGTTITPALEYATRESKGQSVLIIFTDGYHERIDSIDTSKFKRIVHISTGTLDNFNVKGAKKIQMAL